MSVLTLIEGKNLTESTKEGTQAIREYMLKESQTSMTLQTVDTEMTV